MSKQNQNKELAKKVNEILTEMESYIKGKEYSSTDLKRLDRKWECLLIDNRQALESATYKKEVRLYEEYTNFLSKNKAVTNNIENSIYEKCIKTITVVFSGVEIARLLLEYKFAGLSVALIISIIMGILVVKNIGKNF